MEVPARRGGQRPGCEAGLVAAKAKSVRKW